jgi:hypothetical protein
MDSQLPTNITAELSSSERKHSPYFRKIIILIIILVLLGLSGCLFYYYRYKNANGPINVCFLVTKSQSLNCVNRLGLKSTSYSLPSLPNNARFVYLQASPSGRSYVALATGASSSNKKVSSSGHNTNTSAWILNSKLANPVHIKLPSTYTPNYVSWANDSQSLLLTTTNNVGSEISRYNLNNDRLTKLITGKYIHNLNQLANGQIMYWQYNPAFSTASLMTYVMNSNGSNSHLLFRPKSSAISMSYLYDQANSYFFQVALLPSNKGVISGNLQYNVPTYVVKNIWHKVPGTFPGFITQARIFDGYRLLVVFGSSGAEIFNLHTGATSRISAVNCFVGFLNTAPLSYRIE